MAVLTSSLVGICPIIVGVRFNVLERTASLPNLSLSANRIGSTTKPAPFWYSLIISAHRAFLSQGHCPFLLRVSLLISTVTKLDKLSCV